jgi:hypothetical protein
VVYPTPILKGAQNMAILSRQLALTVTGRNAQLSALRVPELRASLCQNPHLHPDIWVDLMETKQYVDDSEALCARPLTPEQIAVVLRVEKRVKPLTALAAHNTLPDDVYEMWAETRIGECIAGNSLEQGKIPAALMERYMRFALSTSSFSLVYHPAGDSLTTEQLYRFADRISRGSSRQEHHLLYLFERRPDIVPLVAASKRLSWWAALSASRHARGFIPQLLAVLENTETERNLHYLSTIARNLSANPWVSASEFKAICASRAFSGIHIQQLSHKLGAEYIAPESPLESIEDVAFLDKLVEESLIPSSGSRYWEVLSFLNRPLSKKAVESIVDRYNQSAGPSLPMWLNGFTERVAYHGVKLPQRATPKRHIEGTESAALRSTHAAIIQRHVISDDVASWELVFGLVDGFEGTVGQFVTNIEALRSA